MCAQENLYNLLPRLEEKAVRPPRYVCKGCFLIRRIAATKDTFCQ